MAVLSLSNVHLAYGHLPLLAGTGFALEAGERLGLIGRNGAGKSSLLKIVAGLERVDDGLLQLTPGLRIRYVAQEPVFDAATSVFDTVADGVAEARALRATYEAHPADADFDALQTRIEALDGWNWEARVQTTLQRLGLSGERCIGALSGGAVKRVALAQALVARPEVLLLDEPTNHLDLAAIAWLEDLLREFRGSVIVVTHDRAFLDAVCTRILELDRGQLRSYPGNFAAYERAKDEQLAAAALADARADKLLAQEEVWVRQGVEARRTRSVARVARLHALRATRAARREALGQVRLEVDAGVRSGRIVAELRDVTKHFAAPTAPGAALADAPPPAGGRTVVERFSATILRGDKVGLIGPNGAGKTTLLRLILGELQPSAGQVRRGTRLQVAYFDQMRSALDLDATLVDTISPGSEWIETAGGRKHVMSYLGDFLFSPERANSPVRTLSGGERNRLLLARLFALPANVLVLDEPTNDLDIDTLELLEQRLQDYPGTVFLVSHDRRFLDHVVTSTIVYEGPLVAALPPPPPEGDEKTWGGPAFSRGGACWREYEGGYEDWQRQRERSAAASTPPPAPKPAPKPVAAAATAAPPAQPSRKLGFKEQRELDALPARIEALEAEQKSIAERLAGAELYTREPQAVGALQARYAQIEDELTAALERWEALGAR